MGPNTNDENLMRVLVNGMDIKIQFFHTEVMKNRSGEWIYSVSGMKNICQQRSCWIQKVRDCTGILKDGKKVMLRQAESLH